MRERVERKQHITKEFDNKEEFELNWVEASAHPIGAVGLWNSMIQIIKMAKEKEMTSLSFAKTTIISRKIILPNYCSKKLQKLIYKERKYFPVVLEDLDKRSLQDIIVIKLTGFGAHSSLLFIIVFLIRCWIIRFRILTQPME